VSSCFSDQGSSLICAAEDPPASILGSTETNCRAAKRHCSYSPRFYRVMRMAESGSSRQRRSARIPGLENTDDTTCRIQFCRRRSERAGGRDLKPASAPPPLGMSFATHLLEDGYDIPHDSRTAGTPRRQPRFTRIPKTAVGGA